MTGTAFTNIPGKGRSHEGPIFYGHENAPFSPLAAVIKILNREIGEEIKKHNELLKGSPWDNAIELKTTKTVILKLAEIRIEFQKELNRRTA